MPISSGVRSILGVFGPLLQAAISGGRSAANLWSTYRSAYQSIGRESPPATIQDMNVVAGGLGSYLTSMGAVTRAADTDALTSEHWVSPIGYSPSESDFAVPTLLATFRATIQTEEGMQDVWRSLTYNTLIPGTVGEIRGDAEDLVNDQLAESSEDEAGYPELSGGSLVGVSDLYLVGKGL
jgi:hypothetical protein